LFSLPTWCTISLLCNICITLNTSTSTCFEQYYAHPQTWIWKYQWRNDALKAN
jgi:hypothetical protein